MRLKHEQPANWEDFQVLGAELLRRLWDCPALQRYGRQGEGQQGIDLIDTSGGCPLRAGQCKLLDASKTFSPRDIEAEVKKALSFRPPLDVYVILTTARPSTRAQRAVIEINRRHSQEGLFSVEVIHWDRIEELLDKFPELLAMIRGGNVDLAVRPISDALQRIESKLDEAIVGSGDPVDGEIDEAKRAIETKDFILGELLLNRLRSRFWDKLSDRQKYRVLGNLGAAFLGRREYARAAQFYLEAKRWQPSDEKARANEALAYQLLGEKAKAFVLAAKLREEFPSQPRPAAIWVNNAPSEIRVEQMEINLGAEVLEDFEVAIALAGRAFDNDDLERALKYSRKATSLLSEHPYGWTLLGRALIRADMAETLSLYGAVPRIQDMERAREAENCLNRAIELSQEADFKEALVETLLERSHLHYLFGRNDLVERDVGTACGLLPDNPVVLGARAEMLRRHGDLDASISVLRKAVSMGETENVLSRLGLTLQQRKGLQDLEEAASIYTKLAEKTEHPIGLRSLWLISAVECLTTSGRLKDANDLIDRFAMVDQFQFLCEILRAMAFLSSGDKDLANEATDRALSMMALGVDKDNVRLLAKTCFDLGRFRDSLPLWRKVATKRAWGSDVGHLLECLSRLEMHEEALGVCEELRKNNVAPAHVLDYELELLKDYDVRAAIRIMQERLSEHPEERFVRLRLSLLGLRLEMPELISAEPTLLPSREQVTPRVAQGVVQVLRLGNRPDDGLRFGYDILRRHWGDPDAHRTYLRAMHPYGPNPNTRSFESVSVGAAVCYREEGDETHHWVIIEDLAGARPELGELSPDHAIARALIGKRVGDSFVVAEGSMQDRTGRVLQILDKYVYRYQDCMHNWQIRFPEARDIESVRVIKADATGKEKFDPSVLLKSIDERHEFGTRVLEAYRLNPVPIQFVGAQFGLTAFETTIEMARQPSAVVVCCRGGGQEREEAIADLCNAGGVVLESTAIATLALLGVTNRIADWPSKLIVSQGTVNQLRGVISKQRYFHSGGVMSKVNGGYTLTEETPEQRESRLKHLREIIDTIESRCMVLSGRPVASLDPDKRKVIVEACGTDGAEAIVISAQPGYVLWTDDLRFAGLARTEFGAKTVWTQVALQWRADNGTISPDLFFEASAKLLGYGYFFTSPSLRVLIRAADLAGWNPEGWPLKQGLEQFADQSIDLKDSVQLCATFLPQIYRHCSTLEAAELVVGCLLKSLDSRPNGRVGISAILQLIDRLFGFDVIGAKRAKEFLRAWLQQTASQVR